jgi:hypothetical protein
VEVGEGPRTECAVNPLESGSVGRKTAPNVSPFCTAANFGRTVWPDKPQGSVDEVKQARKRNRGHNAARNGHDEP